MRDLVTIVTGAARGIGAAIASACAEAGARLVLADLPGAGSTVDGSPVTVLADVSTPDGARAVVDAALAAYGRVDVLVNNAAAYTTGPLHSDAGWQATIAGVLGPVVACTRAALVPMLTQGSGAIVNLGSVNGLVGAPHHGAYAAAKGAVAALTRQVAVDYGPAGIRCNCVSPGFVPHGRSPDPAGLPAYPLRRYGRPEDVAAAVVFLASPAAGFITGVDLPVDGGLTVLSPATLVSPDLRQRWAETAGSGR